MPASKPGASLVPTASSSSHGARSQALTGVHIAVVALDAASLDEHVRALEEVGAIVHGSTDVELPAVLSAADLDAALIDVGHAPWRFSFLAEAGFRAAMRARKTPVVVVADPKITLQQLASLAAIALPSQEPAFVVDALIDLLAARAVSLPPPPVQLLEAPPDRTMSSRARVKQLEDERRTFAHDARVLCSIILGFAANLRDEVTGPLAPMQREHVAHILDVLNDMFAMLERHGEPATPSSSGNATANAAASAASGPTSILPPSTGSSRSLLDDEVRVRRREELDLGHLVRQTATLFETFAAERDVTLDLGAIASATATIDAVQLKQLVTNLLVNAIKFTPPAGRVTIEVRQRPSVNEPTVEIVVRDTGPGIPAADRRRIFERGVRLTRPIDEGVPGSGLGLAVVREVVTDHDGTVDVEDAPGGGASFVIRLPVRARLPRRAAGTASTIMVADGAAAEALLTAIGAFRAAPLDAVHLDTLRDAITRCRALLIIPEDLHPHERSPGVRT
jgi:signal transduction histidine kinase